ncbi:MAG: hypothetical protein R3263_07785 [Myxococcota bacterium]|nr:hypothetical protein [Myxococcota bacterium]
MKAAEALSVLAEVSVAFAGFSGIVTVFRRRNPGDWSALDRFRFRFMIEFSLATLFLSLAPFFAAELGLTEPRLWTACSLLLAVGAGIYLVRTTRRVRRLMAAGEAVSPPVAMLSLAVGVLVSVSALGNAAGLFARPAGVYLAGVGGCLFVSAVLFARLLLSGSPSLPDDEGD